MGIRGVALAGVTVAGTLAAPVAAQSATLTTPRGACYLAGDRVTVTGVGFTPDALVTIEGDARGSAISDGTGAVRTSVTAPSGRAGAGTPRTVSITAHDGGNADNTAAPATFKVVREALDGNYAQAIEGLPTHRTTWRFAGFVPGRPIYGHFRSKGRTRGTYRFGVAGGDCGTLSVRARRIPVRALRRGRWTLQMDQTRRWRKTTMPRRIVPFELYSTGR